MSRYIISVTAIASGATDPKAVIGYDRPLQTFFLQAFPDAAEEDYPALWLGTDYRAFETLATLHAATKAQGYDILPLGSKLLGSLFDDLHRDAIRQVDDPVFAALLAGRASHA